MRSVHERAPEDLEELEELGDDAIISQQTAAHAPRPRANVSEEPRSVVITDHPQRRDTQPPRNAPPRSSAEATLVIRDRRALDELRLNIVRRKTKGTRDRRALYWWCALGLAAFVLGGIVAFLATEVHSEARAPDNPAAPGRAEAQITPPRAPSVASPVNNTARPAHTSAPAPEATHAVRLDDLPVEPPKKR